MNRYSLWVYISLIVVVGLGFLYAAPNLYAPDPAILISGDSSSYVMEERTSQRVQSALRQAQIDFFGVQIEESNLLVRLRATEDQLRAKDVAQETLGSEFIVALNLAATTPLWLSDLGGQPLKLGLDLSGGVHFLLAVDTQSYIQTRLTNYFSDVKRVLRKERIRANITQNPSQRLIRIIFSSEELYAQALSLLRDDFSELSHQRDRSASLPTLNLSVNDELAKEWINYAVEQNLVTLRNRVNELGIAEPLVQRQGRENIVVELPGVQDTAQAKRILGKTANLEFRLEAVRNASIIETERFAFRRPVRGQPRQATLERDLILTGDNVTNAQATFDENGRPQVNINLDSRGGAIMHRKTRNDIGRRMGVLFVERKTRTHRKTDGETVSEKYIQKQIISLATIQSALGSQFRITGLGSTAESSELALLLRAGALPAPIDFVEERTVGPSLGAENIALGVTSVQLGLLLVALFMVIYYRWFGLIANLALFLNLVFLVACMSLLGATLTLPGIAGIVLTVGMAVDANVLIFSRIREELKRKQPPQQSIHSGYAQAFVTIMDANLTTLIVALILYFIGTGPIRGFAVTLSFGILTSMLTAIVFTRAIVNVVYGRRIQLARLPIYPLWSSMVRSA